MVFLSLGEESFCSGRARFEDCPPDKEGLARIFVKFQADGLPGVLYGELDTGSPWSVINPDLAEALEVGSGMRFKLRTAEGSREGSLVRHPITICADQGESLTVEAVWFVPDEPLTRGPFLGYQGFVEVIRVGLDAQNNEIHFGRGVRRTAAA